MPSAPGASGGARPAADAGASTSARARAEELFAELAAAAEDGAPDVEPAARAAPELAAHLRELAERYGELAGALARRSAARSPGAGRYVIARELGRGGMGIVYEVQDRALERPLAMKVLRPAAGGGAADGSLEARRRARFVTEAKVVGRLTHPGIVPIHDLGADPDGRTYLTMPKVEGRTLEELLAAMPGDPAWSLARAVGVLLRVAEALAFAHERGVLHRDLKPANVMIGRFGETYVMDWGLARAVGPGEPAGAAAAGAPDPGVTLEGDVLGTPAYMPPEQAEGRLDELDARADVYALGAILYHLLAGHAPYVPEESPPPAELVLARVRRGPPPPVERERPGVPPELAAICERAMARRREERYADMSALAADLSAWLEGRVVRAYESGPLAELRKWIGRNRRFAAAILGAGAIALAGLGAVALVEARGKARVLSLSDHTLLTELEREAELLWPALPRRSADFDDWLARAEDLARRLGEHRARLAALDAEARARAERARPADPAHGWTFDDPRRRWEHEKLIELVAGLERFAAQGGALADVGARRDWARVIVRRSVGEHASAWSSAAARAASGARYAPLELAPQVGLAPLGPDPRTGFEELAVLYTGAPPERDAAGALALGPDSAAVLVLLPGGDFDMGCRPPDAAHPAGSPNSDPLVAEYGYAAIEGPVHAVAVAPFLIGKHELTRAQWRRLAELAPGAALSGELADALLPAAERSWNQVSSGLERAGLRLPTEAEWEYAARGGTSTPWWTGADIAAVARAERLGTTSGAMGRASPLAEVGRLAANPYGLHDALGNLAEWCRDEPASYEPPYAPLRASDDRSYRGGSYYMGAEHARVTARFYSGPDEAFEFVGVRAARDLDPPGATAAE